MDPYEEERLRHRLIRRLQDTLPNDLESEAQKILADEPLCSKRDIIIALGFCICQHPGYVWTRAANALKQELIRGTTGPPHYFATESATDE